ncbi:MAG TPA: hypothetical protein PK514_14945 [Spirochaetota bacterium]|nr:hypothetical protein [Spirochaetota bacterium]
MFRYYMTHPGMVHVWMLLNMPEANRAVGQIVSLLKDTPGNLRGD